MHRGQSPIGSFSGFALAVLTCAGCRSGAPQTHPVLGTTETSESPTDGSVLPFPSVPSASLARPRLQDSVMTRRQTADHLPEGAPNILVVLLDDVGFGVSETFGGEVKTPTLDRLAQEGIRYNRFHTVSICSPTRASLLTGRNHTRVGSGTIAERAVDWDGYTGVIPKSSATVAEVLKEYGYHTAAFGKWHNTPATETTSMGPKDRWPNGYGFEYFYGFLAGETSQWEPRLFENYNAVEPPKEKGYHLTEDLADRALGWLQDHRSYAPDHPFFMYWAPGAAHGPHHVAKEWADKYKGQFDDGWDAYRERTYRRQLDQGIIPKGTELTARDPSLPGWDSVPEAERPFQRRLMEVFAGFVEHTDRQVGRLIDGLDGLGYRDNTIVIYIFGDNGSSAEGQNGTVSELLAQNQLANTVEQQLAALKELGGLSALGGPKMDNMYHAGWAWAGSTPFRSTKLIASHFGGTRNPMVISWPKRIRPDGQMRSQFLHVNDVVPTLYDAVGIAQPKEVNRIVQDPMDGKSFAPSFADPTAKVEKATQFFDNNGSRGIYHQGWFAGTFGPLYPWISAQKGLADWDSAEDKWELYHLDEDFSQADNVADAHPERVNAMKSMFLEEAEANHAFPIGAGIWLRTHPQDIQKTPYVEWDFGPTTQRMPEFTAPGLGKESSRVDIDLEVEPRASGVLYALGGASGGLAVYMDNGRLVYEYNLMIIENYRAESRKLLPAGQHRITVLTEVEGNRPGAPAAVTLKVGEEVFAEVKLNRTVPLGFTASETFDVGRDLGSAVSMRYFDRAPFAFSGHIKNVHVALTGR
jgi:arylsulfatase A-like enzyme